MKPYVKIIEKTIIKKACQETIEIPQLLWEAIDQNSDLCRRVRRQILEGFGYDPEITTSNRVINDYKKNKEGK